MLFISSAPVSRLIHHGLLWICLLATSGDLLAERKLPKISARSVIVIDADKGFTLYEKNADERVAVASTQKLLTALIVAESGNLDAPVKVERTDTQVQPSKVGIQVGKEYPRGVLLQALLVKSGNDVAKCLARDHAGSQEEFASVMNARARSLGMSKSHFCNAHGLTEPDQLSTARDMAKLAFMCWRNETIRAAVTIKELSFSHPGGSTTTLRNTNRLLHGSPYCLGMKTGYTDAAGRCLVSAGTYGDRNIITILLGSDSKGVLNESRELMNWALQIPENEPEVTLSPDTSDSAEN